MIQTGLMNTNIEHNFNDASRVSANEEIILRNCHVYLVLVPVGGTVQVEYVNEYIPLYIVSLCIFNIYTLQ